MTRRRGKRGNLVIVDFTERSETPQGIIDGLEELLSWAKEGKLRHLVLDASSTEKVDVEGLDEPQHPAMTAMCHYRDNFESLHSACHVLAALALGELLDDGGW